MIKLPDGRTVYGIRTENSPAGYIALFSEYQQGYAIPTSQIQPSILVKIIDFLGVK